MRKIAMIAAFPPPIGGQSLAAQILKDGLDPNEFKIYALNLSESIGGDHFVKRVAKLGGIAAKLFALCIREKELIVYLQMGFGRSSILRDMVYLTIARLFRKNAVVHVHGSGFRIAFDSLPMPLRKLEQKIVSGLKTIIVLSDCLKPMFEGLTDSEHIQSVPNGVAPDVVQSAMSFSRGRRAPGETFNVLFLSNLLRMKGFETMLKVAEFALKRGDNWHFDIVGPKIEGQGPDIEAYIAEHGLEQIVSWHTTVSGDEKMDYYKKAHCFVLPSFYEGQPLTILEAMHFALPIAAKPIGGNPDIFVGNESGVLWFGDAAKIGTQPDISELDALISQDADALDAILQQLASDIDRCERMGAQNLAFARQNYTPEVHCARMAELFNQA